MRSYEASRRSFSFLEIVAKALIALGVIAVIIVLLVAADKGAIALLGVIPGLAIMAMGFFGQAYVQTGRASVDCAEYAQQSLQLARDQFEISKQMLRQASASPSALYEATDTDLQNVSYDTDQPANKSPDKPPVKPETLGNVTIEYRNQKIEKHEDAFLVNDRKYPTLIEAKSAVDATFKESPFAKIKL